MPAVFLASGLIGLAVSDPERRAETVAFIAGVLPPLHDVIEAILAEAGRDAAPLGVFGAASLAWGASRFGLALSEAVDRAMGRTSRRGALRRNVGSIGAVLFLVGAMVAGTALAGLASFADAAEDAGLAAVLGPIARLLVGFVPPAIAVLAAGFVYRVVPTPAPGWRAIGLPALVAGLALTVLLEGFVFLVPRLIGAAALLGTIATVFAALAWLALSFRAVLLGAAWVAEREALPGSARGA